MSNARTAKKPLPRTATASIAILVYSIIPYLNQKVQENRYFTSFLPVIHSFFRPVDNYYFSSWAGGQQLEHIGNQSGLLTVQIHQLYFAVLGTL